ncbi:MAG: winged helix-turn-helix transcriptional regulator [Candidatus Thorarchaeota archaeon]|nr:MAG: winged helix-turn-helix transcriptional regulator [Candidatus Thorarchaeota archaeon]
MRILNISRRAYLHWVNNVRPGLITRTKIILLLEEGIPLSPTEISGSVGVTASTVSHHLFNMEREEIVQRFPEDPKRWTMGPWLQADLSEYLRSGKRTPKKKRTHRKKR